MRSLAISVCIMIDLWNQLSSTLRSSISNGSNVHIGAIDGYVAVNGDLVLTSEDAISLLTLEQDYGDLVRSVARDKGHLGGVRFDVDRDRMLLEAGVTVDEGATSLQTSLFDVPELPVSTRHAEEGLSAALRVGAPLRLENAYTTEPAPRVDVALDDVVRAARLQLSQSFTNWVAGDDNAVLARSAKALATRANSAIGNLLYIYGGAGNGKSHILNAIGVEALRNNSSLNVQMWSGEDFVNAFVASLHNKTQADFRRRTRQKVDVFLFDDLDFLENKPAAQDELASILRELARGECRVVVTGRKLPAENVALGERIRGAVAGSLNLDIKPMSVESRLQMVHLLVQRHGQRIADDAARYIAQTVQASASDVVEAVKRIAAYGMMSSAPISLELVTAQLPQVYKSNLARPTVDLVIDVVAEHFQLSVEDILAGGRTKNLAFARQLAMYLARQATERSYPELARKFRKKDHTTVLHAIKAVSSRLAANDRQTAEAIETLSRRLAI